MKALSVSAGCAALALMAAVATAPAVADTAPVASTPQIVPLPAQMTADTGTFTLTPGATIAAPAAATAVANQLAAVLRPSTGYALPVSSAATGDIALDLSGAAGLGDEGYTLDVTPAGVKLSAAKPAGLFYGVQTLRQLLPVWVESPTVAPGPWTIPATHITDTPRYPYRGVMLDIARHFEPPSVVKKLIDEASAYKVNVLHLHVSDDQGFRIVINGRPELTQIGAQFSINNDPGGFWTQDEFKDVVKYAAEHFMTVVPEVDTPGHNNAIIMAFNTGPADQFNVFSDINCSTKTPPVWNLTSAVGYSSLCPGTLPGAPNAHTWAILTDVITQLAAMASSPYYDLGGDEVPTSLMSAANYNAFVDYESQIVRAQGKNPMGWADISSAGFNRSDALPGIAEFWANGSPTGSGGDTARLAVQKGMKVVMAPANHTYLDQKQVSGSPIGMTWACTCDLSTFYNWGTTAPTGDPATYIPARTAATTTALAPVAAGANRIYTASVSNLGAGHTLNIDTTGGVETATVTAVGAAPGAATTLAAPAAAGDTNLKVTSITGWTAGHPAVVDSGASLEQVTVAAVGTAGASGTGITLSSPLASAHASGAAARDAGTGTTFTPALTAAHGAAVTVTDTLPAVTDSNIIGVEGSEWSETLRNMADIEFMAYPRTPALAELGWSPKTGADRTLASFEAREVSQGPRWQLRGQNFYPTAQVPWRVDVAAPDRSQPATLVDGPVATVAAPGAPLAQLSATIDWGDGTTSAGTLTGTEATNKTSNSLYTVSGTHTYAGPGGYAAKVTVARTAAATATAPFDVSVNAVASGSAGGSVPATLSLSLGAAAAFGPFTPGIAKDYTAATTAGVNSTAGDAALSVTDPSPTAPGHLVNGAFSLPSALQAAAGAGAFAAVGTSPLTLLTYAAPVSNDPVTLTFRQSIGATDALRTGSYAKTLVFTLSTTTP